MENNAAKSDQRLKQLLVCDKSELSDLLCKVIKHDVEQILINYVNLTPDSLFINYNINKDGAYHFNISFDAVRIKQAGHILR